MEPSAPSARFERLRRRYRDVAIFAFNSLLVLLLFNLVLYAVFAALDASRGPAARFEDWMGGYVQKLGAAYPELAESDVRELVRETVSLTYAYEPFTQFRDRSQQGKFVNVDANGFRHSLGQGPWPPSRESFNVFFFGGSTAFGWGLPDWSTIPSLFHELAPQVGGRPCAVYNFSRMAYFSTQERILFEQLLLAGHKPDAAIFVDGLNDLHWREGKPLYDGRFASVLEARPSWNPDWPMLRLARVLRKHLPKAQAASDDPPRHATQQAFQAALDRYVSNKALIESASAAAGVVPIFVWQPVPAYKHDGRRYFDRFHDSVPWRIWSLEQYAPVYQQVEELSGAGQLGRTFVWCGGVQQGLDEVLYIDLVHYTPRLSQMVADCIVSQVRERGLIPLASAHTEGTPGAPRAASAGQPKP